MTMLISETISLFVYLFNWLVTNYTIFLLLISFTTCRKMLVPLPLGLVYLGRCYQLLTSFSFVSMGHGVKLADAIDGLAGGTAALAFTGMSIAVLPVCSG